MSILASACPWVRAWVLNTRYKRSQTGSLTLEYQLTNLCQKLSQVEKLQQRSFLPKHSLQAQKLSALNMLRNKTVGGKGSKLRKLFLRKWPWSLAMRAVLVLCPWELIFFCSCWARRGEDTEGWLRQSSNLLCLWRYDVFREEEQEWGTKGKEGL